MNKKFRGSFKAGDWPPGLAEAAAALGGRNEQISVLRKRIGFLPPLTTGPLDYRLLVLREDNTLVSSPCIAEFHRAGAPSPTIHFHAGGPFTHYIATTDREAPLIAVCGLSGPGLPRHDVLFVPDDKEAVQVVKFSLTPEREIKIFSGGYGRAADGSLSWVGGDTPSDGLAEEMKDMALTGRSIIAEFVREANLDAFPFSHHPVLRALVTDARKVLNV